MRSMRSTLLATQAKLTAIPEQISALETAICDTAHRVQGLQQDEEALTAQERRFTTLNDSAFMLASDLAERIDLLRGLQTELANTTALKAQLCDELVQLQSMHRETLQPRAKPNTNCSSSPLPCQQIEERRAHVARRSAPSRRWNAVARGVAPPTPLTGRSRRLPAASVSLKR